MTEPSGANARGFLLSDFMDTELSITPKNDIIIASFRLHENGLEPIGEPNFDQWVACGDFIHRSQKAMHFWIGDWLNYGEHKWGEKYKEALVLQRRVHGPRVALDHNE